MYIDLKINKRSSYSLWSPSTLTRADMMHLTKTFVKWLLQIEHHFLYGQMRMDLSTL